MDSFSRLLDIDPHPPAMVEVACWLLDHLHAGMDIYFHSHTQMVMYTVHHCFLILPGSLLSVLAVEFPPPGFAGEFVEGAGESLGEAAGLGCRFPSDAFSVPFSTFCKDPFCCSFLARGTD